MKTEDSLGLFLHPPKRVGHLGIIADLLRSMGVLDLIDEVCGSDPRMKVSHGECVRVLLLGVFAGEHGLWRLSERLDPYDMATLTGDPGVDLREFHDVRLGRMLDAVWDAGPERLLSALSLRVVEWARLELGTLHFDTTTLSFYGAYEEDLDDSWTPELDAVLDPGLVPQRCARTESSVDGDGRTAPVVTHGYAKNGRHDLKQILFGLVVAGDGAVPLYGRAMDGNASDITAAAAFLDHLHTQIPDPYGQVFVADSKGWAPPSLECVRRHRLRLLSRLPRSTTLANTVVSGLDLETAPCVLKRYRHDRKRWSWVAYAGRDCDYTYTVAEPVLDDAGLPTRDESGALITRARSYTLPVRAVACYSSELYRQKAETLGAIARREAIRAAKLIARLARRTWACATDAQAELDALLAKQPFITKHLIANVERREITRLRPRRGRPAHGDTPPAPDIRYGWRITATDTDPAEHARRLRRAATYVLIRNRLDTWQMTDEQMVATYSKQWRVEHAFSWLKSGAAINPMFLESPRRIQALCFLYCLALMLHALVQRNVRKHLKDKQLALPYHRGKPSDNITARFTYELFRNVTTQVVDIGGERKKIIHGLDQWTAIALTGIGASPRAYLPVMEHGR
jgi:transposase